MSKLKGTKTESNLLISFAGESMARNRYSYFASKAKKEGYVQISQIFEETANQEKEHAKRFFSFLEGGDLEIKAPFPAGIISCTADNLRHAAQGEHHEYSVLYPSFAKIARDEGFSEIAALFDNVSVAEKQHEKRFLQLMENIYNKTVFEKKEEVTWRCLNCGYLYKGRKAPAVCPACAHPRDHFEILAENW